MSCILYSSRLPRTLGYLWYNSYLMWRFLIKTITILKSWSPHDMNFYYPSVLSVLSLCAGSLVIISKHSDALFVLLFPLLLHCSLETVHSKATLSQPSAGIWNKTIVNLTFMLQFKLNTLCDLLRQEIAQAGFTEVLTFALVRNFILIVNSFLTSFDSSNRALGDSCKPPSPQGAHP